MFFFDFSKQISTDIIIISGKWTNVGDFKSAQMISISGKWNHICDLKLTGVIGVFNV